MSMNEAYRFYEHANFNLEVHVEFNIDCYSNAFE